MNDIWYLSKSKHIEAGKNDNILGGKGISSSKNMYRLRKQKVNILKIHQAFDCCGDQYLNFLSCAFVSRTRNLLDDCNYIILAEKRSSDGVKNHF